MLFIKTKEVRPEGMPEVFQVAAPIIDQSVQHLQEIQTLEEGTREPVGSQGSWPRAS